MIKLICSDVDNTLLFDKNGTIDKETFDAIGRAEKKGILFAVISGRPLCDLQRFFGEKADSLILASYEGALVTYKGKTLWDKPIDRNLYNSFADCYKDNKNVEYVIYTKDAAYVRDISGSAPMLLKESVSMNGRIFECAPDKIKDPVYKLSLVSQSGTFDFDFEADKWNSYMYNIYTGGHWCEFTAKDMNKDYSIHMIMEILGFNRSEVMAFGDGLNDIGMLSACDFSFAMSNASDEVKNAAQFTTDNVARTVRSFIENNGK